MAQTWGITLDKASLRHVEGVLDKLPDNAQRKVIGQASKKSLKPVVKTARGLVPRRSGLGLLRKSLGVIQRKYNRSGIIYSMLGPRTGFEKKSDSGDVEANPVKYAHLVEYGTKPHLFESGGKHPGARPKPFMRKSYAQHADGVVRDMERFIEAGVGREASKMSRRTPR